MLPMSVSRSSKDLSSRLRRRIQQGYLQVKELHGDPHYVAMGMAIGIFVACTPTIPFHTVIAVFLSFLLRGSKVAAAIGVWFSNPLTIPLLYWASYKIGSLLIPGARIPQNLVTSLPQLFKLGLTVSLSAILGGVLLGILPAVAAYGLTRRLMAITR
jgi:uncharacterized protein (DUF2062 family)